VKPYVKTNKSDYIDAEAIAEARMIRRREGQRTAIAVELGNQDTVAPSGQLQTAVSGKIVALSRLHSNPPEEMGSNTYG